MDITIITNLTERLHAHLERYQELIDFLDMEKKYLLNLDLEALYLASQAKEALGRNIQDSIKELTSSLSDVALMLGLPTSPPPTLGEVAQLCPRPYDNQINDGAIKLAHLKNIILRENEANRHFVKEALNLVNESINIMTGADQLKGEGYRNDGTKDQTVAKSLPTKLSKEV